MTLLFGSILLYSVASIANGFVHSIEAYVVWRFVAGFGLAGELGGGITFVTEILPRELRAYGTAIVSTVGVVGVVIGGLVAQKVEWRTSYFIGLTEKFNLSLQILDKLAPCPLDLHFKRLIVAKNDKIQKALLADPRMLELAREHNRLDLELYAFAMNEIFPRLCQKAGVNPADKVPPYEVTTNDRWLKYKFGRVYNKVFRQIYKVRHRIFNPNDTDLPALKL